MRPKEHLSFADIRKRVEETSGQAEPMHFTFDGQQFQTITGPRADSTLARMPDLSKTRNIFGPSRPHLSLISRRSLMLKVARVTLQLFDSPWLPQGWTTRCISQLERLLRKSWQQGRAHDYGLGAIDDPAKALHPNPLLLQLGILFMKIELGDVLDERQRDNNLVQGNRVNITDIDWLWADKEYRRLKTRLYGPIRRSIELCLYPAQLGVYALPHRLDFTSVRIRDVVHNAIVAPLEIEQKSVKERGGLWNSSDENAELLGILLFEVNVKGSSATATDFWEPHLAKMMQERLRVTEPSVYRSDTPSVPLVSHSLHVDGDQEYVLEMT